jgi:hypothetical protein
MVFRRRDGRLVYIGAPLGIVEQQIPNYGRALLDMERGDLIPVTQSWDDAERALIALVVSPLPPSPRSLSLMRRRRPA